MNRKKNIIGTTVSSFLLLSLSALFMQQHVFANHRTLTIEDMKMVKGVGCAADSVAGQAWMGCAVSDCYCEGNQSGCTGSGERCLGTGAYSTSCTGTETTQGCQDYTKDCGAKETPECYWDTGEQKCKCRWISTGSNCLKNAKQTVSSCP